MTPEQLDALDAPDLVRALALVVLVAQRRGLDVDHIVARVARPD